MTECCVCSDALTLKTIVNLECGHSFCKDCIWRWTKDKNTCPCCRANILGNTKELQEMQHMRELITHRSQIVRQVEEEYERVDMLKSRANNIEKGIRMAEKELDRQRDESDRERKKFTFYKQLNKGTYTAIKCLEKKLRKQNKNMETIQTRDYHEFVFQGEVLLDLKDLLVEAKQRDMSATTLITFQKRQKRVQIMRQEWQEELEQCQYEIENEGLRLDRMFDDIENAEANAEENEQQNMPEDQALDDYSDMPPLEQDLLDPDDIIRATSRYFPGRMALAEHLDNIIQLSDRDAFLNSMIRYFNDIEPMALNINNINNINNNINNINNNINNINNDMAFDPFLA